MIALHVRHAVIVLIVAILVAFHCAPGHIVEGVEAFGRVAIAQQLEVGTESVKGFCVQEPQGLPFMAAIIGKLAASMGEIK